MNKRISAAQVVEKLRSEQGWIVTGGEVVGAIPHLEPNVISADCSEELLRIGLPDRVAEAPVDDIVLVEPWMIQVYQSHARREQKKNIEGGGWHDVLVPIAAIRLRNHQLQKELARKAKFAGVC